MPDKQQAKWVGTGMKRKEDLRLLTGRGRFMDDIRLPNMKYAAILRSPYPHAWIRGMEISRALKVSGVRGVLTGEDVAAMSKPFPVGVPIPPEYYSCAVDKVRYVGGDGYRGSGRSEISGSARQYRQQYLFAPVFSIR
jgi:2-furoyl-CoA dehydrogenase large subunit